MKHFCDPVTAMVAMTAVTTALGVATTLGQGAAAEQQAEAEAADMKQQARAVDIQGARDVRDEREQQKLRTSRMLALSAARGRGSDLLQTIGRDVGESAIRQHRIKSDAAAQSYGLRVGSRNVREAGDFERRQSYVRAGTTLLQGATQAASFSSMRAPSGGTPTTPAHRTNRFGRLSGPV